MKPHAPDRLCDCSACKAYRYARNMELVTALGNPVPQELANALRYQEYRAEERERFYQAQAATV